MVGILLSYWEGQFSGAMLVSGSVAPEKWWLEDKPFLLGFGNCSGANSLNFGGSRIDGKESSHSMIEHEQAFRWNFSIFGGN